MMNVVQLFQLILFDTLVFRFGLTINLFARHFDYRGYC